MCSPKPLIRLLLYVWGRSCLLGVIVEPGGGNSRMAWTSKFVGNSERVSGGEFKLKPEFKQQKKIIVDLPGLNEHGVQNRVEVRIY